MGNEFCNCPLYKINTPQVIAEKSDTDDYNDDTYICAKFNAKPSMRGFCAYG